MSVGVYTSGFRLSPIPCRPAVDENEEYSCFGSKNYSMLAESGSGGEYLLNNTNDTLFLLPDEVQVKNKSVDINVVYSSSKTVYKRDVGFVIVCSILYFYGC